jgi:hypothetical protein
MAVSDFPAHPLGSKPLTVKCCFCSIQWLSVESFVCSGQESAIVKADLPEDSSVLALNPPAACFGLPAILPFITYTYTYTYTFPKTSRLKAAISGLDGIVYRSFPFPLLFSALTFPLVHLTPYTSSLTRLVVIPVLRHRPVARHSNNNDIPPSTNLLVD